MAKNKKRIVFPFKIQHFRAMELYFEEMAAKGWMLSKLTADGAIFTKSEPQQLEFNVIIPTIEKDSHQALIEKAISLGWSFVLEYFQFRIYCIQAEKPVERLQSISEAEYKIMTQPMKLSASQFIISIFQLFIFSAMAYMRLKDESYLYNNYILIFLIFPVFLLFFTIYNGLHYFDFKRIQNFLKAGRPLPPYTIKPKITSNVLMKAATSVLFLVVTALFAFDILNRKFIDWSFILMPIFILSIIPFIYLITKQSKQAQLKTRKKIVGAFVLYMIIFLGSSFFVADLLYKKPAIPPKDALVLQYGDLGISGVVSYSRYRQSASLFVPRHFKFRQDIEGHTGMLESEYIKASNSTIAKHFFDKKYASKSRYRTDRLTEIPAEPWEADMVFGMKTYKKNVYYLLMLKGDIVVELEGDYDFDFSSPSSVAVITEKLRLKE